MEQYLSRMISCIKIEFIAGNTTRIEQEKHDEAVQHSHTHTPSNCVLQCTPNENDKLHKLNTIMYKLCYCRVLQIPNDGTGEKTHSHTHKQRGRKKEEARNRS